MIGPSRRTGSAGELLDLDALTPDGLLVRGDGVLARVIELGCVNPWVLAEEDADRLSACLAGLLDRLPAGAQLQFIAEARPLALAQLLADERRRTLAVLRARADGEQLSYEQAYGLARLQGLCEEQLQLLAERDAALSYRFLLVVPLGPPRRRRARRAGAHKRLVRELDERVALLRGDLEGLGIDSRVLDGGELAALLWAWLNPTSADRASVPVVALAPEPAPLEPDVRPERAREAARALRERFAQSGVTEDASGAWLQVEQDLHVTIAVARAPQATTLGWLTAALQAGRPYRLAVHLRVLDQHAERRRYASRYRLLWAAQRDQERKGLPPSFENSSLESELTSLNQRLAGPDRVRVYQASVYQTLRVPSSGEPRQAEELLHAARQVRDELVAVSQAEVTLGAHEQLQLWRSTLPLAVDYAARWRRYLSDVIGDMVPLLGAECGCPDGVPVWLQGNRSIARFDPIDPVSLNWLTVIVGAAGAGKTMLVQELCRGMLRRGMRGYIVDRADHYRPLAEQVGGAFLQLGAGAQQHVICPWDVPDVAEPGPEKLTFLCDLHAALIGRHATDADDDGLSPTERGLLSAAIAAVYRHAAHQPDDPLLRPCESRLAAVLAEHAQREQQARAGERAGVLRELADRLLPFYGQGKDAWLLDRPTTVPATGGHPLVVFDTSFAPEPLLPAAMLVVTEYVKRQAEQARAARAGRDPDPLLRWLDYPFLVTDETSFMVARAGSGRAINEFGRKSRHWQVRYIAVSQRLEDLDNDWGKALLSSAEQQVFLAQRPNDYQVLARLAGLAEHELELIKKHVRTTPGKEARAYLVNGPHGRGIVSLRVGPQAYWASTSHPADLPVRDRALEAADGDWWAAIDSLAGTDTPTDEDREAA